MKSAVKISLFFFVTGVAGAAWYFWPPDVAALKTRNPVRTRMMSLRSVQAAKAGRPYQIRHAWVPLGRISVHLKHAVLVAEDARFYRHRGVDWEALRRSVRQDIRRRKLAFGGSTITQQVAKNVYLSPRKSFLRKLKELEIALLMERALSKNRILEIYLNVAEWGDGVFGAEAAARTYFGKSAADLTPGEAASLAAVLPSPRRHSPAGDGRYLARRREWVLKWMARSGFLPAPDPAEAPVFSPPEGLMDERGPAGPEETEEDGDGSAPIE